MTLDDHPTREIATTRQRVRIRTKHGSISIGPNGQLSGLWRIVRAEILTAQEVRKLAGVKSRQTLIEWRRNRAFPKPVLSIPAKGGTVELWERTAVEHWLDDRKTKRSTLDDRS